MFAEFGKYTQSLDQAGALIVSDPLQPPDTATTVRAQGSETLTTDGPFAETKEWLGGYYQIEVDSLDDALEWPARIPSVKQGGSVIFCASYFTGNPSGTMCGSCGASKGT